MAYFDPEKIESRYWDTSDVDVDSLINRPIQVDEAMKASTPGEIGVSANPMIHQGAALGQAIRSGGKRIELGVMGRGKGSESNFTPESYTSEERREIYNLAKLNKVETSFHSSPNVMNISGFTGKDFNEEARQEALSEIKKAVDFAAEATTGGAVVLHVHEWQRSVGSEYGTGNIKDGDKFEAHGQDYKSTSDKSGYGTAQMMFVDEKTQQIQSLRRDMDFREAEVESVSIESETDTPYIKYNYKKNSTTGEINSEVKHYDDIIKLENQMHNTSDDKFGKFAEFSKKMFPQLENRWNEIEAMDEDSDAEVRQKEDAKYLYHFMRKQADSAYEQFLSSDSSHRYYGQMRDDSRMLDESKQRRDMAWVNFQDKLDNITKLKPIEEYGKDKVADTVSDAAFHAWERSKDNKKLDKNLYISPESWTPGNFGSHPDEMMKVIDESRTKLAEKFVDQKIAKDMKSGEDEAKKYIKATLDIGHLNTWRKFFVRKDKESYEDYNGRFNKWALEKSEEMAKGGYVGHAHLSDNFGYDDEHLSVGQGNAPIKEFVEKLKNHKVGEFIVELGSTNATTALREAWSHLGTRMIGGNYLGKEGNATPTYFSQMYDAYVPHLRKPNYVFGKYIPEVSNEKWNNWRPWSGIRL